MSANLWNVPPNVSRIYGEVVAGRDIDGGTETESFIGYASDESADVADLVPNGWYLLESLYVLKCDDRMCITCGIDESDHGYESSAHVFNHYGCTDCVTERVSLI